MAVGMVPVARVISRHVALRSSCFCFPEKCTVCHFFINTKKKPMIPERLWTSATLLSLGN